MDGWREQKIIRKIACGVSLLWAGIFDSFFGTSWCLFLLFFSLHPPLLGNKHICASSSSIYYYISTLHYLTLAPAPI